MAVPGTFTSGQVLTAAEMNALPGGQLAIATDAADFTATTSGVDVVNTSVTLTSSRILKITFFAGALTNPSTNLQASIDLRNGPIATATAHYANSSFAMGTASDANIVSSCGVYSATFAAGTHDFYMTASSSTGTFIVNGAAVRLNTLIVEDVGEG